MKNAKRKKKEKILLDKKICNYVMVKNGDSGEIRTHALSDRCLKPAP